jgi:transposase InsO family protein
VLQRVWAFSGGECGKYLAASMRTLLDALERHGELVAGKARYSPEVRAELLAMSPATIDRYLAPMRARDPLRGKSTTKPSPLLRSSITIRKAGDEVEAEPGFFEGDTVAHCGPTLKGEFARTLNLTDMRSGWVFTRSMRNNAHVHVLAALDHAVAGIPFEITGLDFDNGSEFINHDVIGWTAERKIFFTRSRPYKKNDQATIESKNNHLVRRYGFYWRYDTPEALVLLNQLWPLVNDRLNYFTPTKKPVGWATDTAGRRKRVYDKPATPLDRLLAAGVLSPAQEAELTSRRDALNPAELARRIQSIQDRLTGLARDATLALQATVDKPLPDTARGVKLRDAS